MPSNRKRNQPDTFELNHSPQVTVIRRLVEAIHGNIGQKLNYQDSKENIAEFKIKMTIGAAENL